LNQYFTITMGEPLHIAMIIDVFDGDSKNGAVISTQRITESLRKMHRVTVVATGTPEPGKVILPKFYAPFVDGIMRKMKTPLAVPFNNLLKSAIEGCDIVHVQFPFYLGVRAIHFARKFGIPVVTTFHIQAEHLARNAGIRSNLFIQQTYHYWMHNIYNLSDMVVCPSAFAREELMHYGLTAPSTVISNGIMPLFRPMEAVREKRFSDRFVILSVGRYAPEKRQEIIIRAVDRSRYRDRIQLILVGDGPMKEKLRDLGKTLPCPPLFSTLECKEMVTCYNQADLYVHAADVEVECMSVLEAMACGLPPLIASSPKSATCQFALDEQWLFDYANLDELVTKIDYWISHPEEMKRAREQYLNLSEHYRFENSLNQLLGVYEQLARNRA